MNHEMNKQLKMTAKKPTFYRFDMEDFKYNNVNMTAFRIVDSNNPKVEKLCQNVNC